MINDNILFGITEEHLCPDESGQFLLNRQVLKPFTHLQRACNKKGLSCDIVSSFRNLSRQLSIWEQKWTGRLPIRDRNGAILPPDSLNDVDKIFAILTWSALPGASRHHWGTDIDVYDKVAINKVNWQFELVPEEYSMSGPCSSLNQFLDENLQEYGFYRPYAIYQGGIAEEPWHISYRPTSQEFEQVFTLQRYQHFLNGLSFSGKDLVLAHFDTIFERFVLNKGNKI